MKVKFEPISSLDINNILRIENPKNIKDCLRQIRENECFKFVDRPIWYKKLTTVEQLSVDTWYDSWLRVTDTFVIPERPNFIK